MIAYMMKYTSCTVEIHKDREKNEKKKKVNLM